MLNVLELFSGIGSQKKALDNLKINNRIVATADWDIFAIISYAVIHHNKEFVNKFTNWNERFAKANTQPRERERERERERDFFLH